MVLIEHDKIDLDYFTENVASGGKGGNSFKFMKEENGAKLKKIEAWQEGWRIRGVKVTMTDKTSYMAGRPAGSHKGPFELADDELIERLNIQPSGETSSGGYYRLGAIWMKTSKNREWGIFSRYLQNTQHWADVGSGVCCGVFGAGGADVDRFGMAMLRPVIEAELVDVTYPGLDLNTVSSQPSYIAHRIIDNRGGSVPSVATLEMSETVGVEKTWSSSFNWNFGVSVTVSAGIPSVMDVDSTYEWGIGGESSHSTTESETRTIKHSWPVTAPPHVKTKADGKLYSDEIETPYNGTMMVTLDNKKCYSYHVSGEYKGASYVRTELVIKETPR